MRKMIRLGFLAFSQHIGMYCLLLLQILMILLGMNVLLASYQQQAMLEEPFADILQQDGYYLHEYGLATESPISSQLHGEKEILGFSSYACNAKYGDLQYPTMVIVYDDTFWNDYQPVMQHGKWMAPDLSGEKASCVATANCPSSEITIPGVSTKLEAAGVLNDLTYIPLMDSWSRNDGLSDNFYYTFDTDKEETYIC